MRTKYQETKNNSFFHSHGNVWGDLPPIASNFRFEQDQAFNWSPSILYILAILSCISVFCAWLWQVLWSNPCYITLHSSPCLSWHIALFLFLLTSTPKDTFKSLLDGKKRITLKCISFLYLLLEISSSTFFFEIRRRWWYRVLCRRQEAEEKTNCCQSLCRWELW